jgi:rRNA-processing protein FCF1
MIFLIILTLTSLAGVGIALSVPVWADLILVSGPCAIASGLLLVLGWRRRASAKKWVILDGSNVLYWKENTPDIATVKEVLHRVSDLGYTPCVIFDANAGYVISDRYRGDRDFSYMLNLPKNQVLVVPKGEPADPTILKAAQKLGAVIVTNDRFRDWETFHPEVREEGYLAGGGYASGQLWVNLDAA